tara:strand:- start:765 stop:1886 length:1122 start_codon:yes stop_codon:yes gene_type:complete
MNIIKELFEKDCIKTGNFRLKNGELSKYYFDMKNLVSYPKLLSKIGDRIYNMIDRDSYDIICGVPLGGLPIASYISTTYNIPMIMVRDNVKDYGTSKLIEGVHYVNSRCLIIEDVITTGGSVQGIIDKIGDKVSVMGVAVVLDRQQGFKCSVPVKSLITKTDIVGQKMVDITVKKNSRLCFSADIEDKEKLIKVLDDIGKHIVVCKIHYDIYNDSDESIKNALIDLSIKHDFLIMEDRKFVDISYIANRQYNAYKNWVDLVTVMSSVSDEVIKGMSGVMLVANMSNNKKWDYTLDAINLAKNNRKNVIGFITQKRITIDGMICMTPGISLESKRIADQNYRSINDVDTDILIVGRGIYSYSDYIEKAKAYSLL